MSRIRDLGNYSMTSCSKGGIKIKRTNNDYQCDPFSMEQTMENLYKKTTHTKKQFTNDEYEELDLNIENYSSKDIYRLFGLDPKNELTEDLMKSSKKIVLKTHPDKSRLENKYFLFFTEAYKKLFSIYEFQNKSDKMPNVTESGSVVNNDSVEFDTDKKELLTNFIKKNFNTTTSEPFQNTPSATKERTRNTTQSTPIANKDIINNKKDTVNKEGADFNKWFNAQFEKHYLDDAKEKGYGDWLKSDEGIQFNTANVKTLEALNREMEKKKKQVQSLVEYKGVTDAFMASSVGGYALVDTNKNFSSGALFSNDGMDLKQAYDECIIPVTEDDFNKRKQYRNVEDYKHHRNIVDTTPLSVEESIQQLLQQEKMKNEESVAAAFYQAQQLEKNKKQQDAFWSSLKQISNN
jgi:hypothetical protein